MRTITMLTHKDGKLSGEVLEDGRYWQIAPFDFDGKDKESALMDRLGIVQIEAQMDAELAELRRIGA